jgi:hypothetical protein
MARPSEYDYELCELICEEIAQGKNITEVLKDPRFPAWSTFRRWKRNNEELRTLYVNSQQDKAEALESEIDDLRDMLLAKEIDPATYNTLVQTLKWKMAKYYPKVFGDNKTVSTDITTNGESIQQTPQWVVIDGKKK